MGTFVKFIQSCPEDDFTKLVVALHGTLAGYCKRKWDQSAVLLNMAPMFTWWYVSKTMDLEKLMVK